MDRTWNEEKQSAFFAGGYYQYSVSHQDGGLAFRPSFCAEPAGQIAHVPWEKFPAALWVNEVNGFQVRAFSEEVGRLDLLRGVSAFDSAGMKRSRYDVTKRPWYKAALGSYITSKIYPYFNGSGLGLSTMNRIGEGFNEGGARSRLKVPGGPPSADETEIEGVLAWDTSLDTLSERMREVLAPYKSGDLSIELTGIIADRLTGELVAEHPFLRPQSRDRSPMATP